MEKSKLKEYIIYIVIILVVILVRTFIVTPIKVNGTSMVDTLEGGDIMILKKYDKTIERFDIVVVDYNGEKIIKRVIGMPLEDITYKDNVLYVNGEVVDDVYATNDTDDFVDYCGEDEYFVMGDNREVSKDSRAIGCVNKEDILGTTSFIIFPFTRWGSVN